ncbi:serine protein kinase RIO [Leifsonia sp. NPDC058292]|uniref:serine protein kinase RIO n=1 Tax=Leifsonia sp. NPDC058292 TaxID=3346428 RepID=UPI0036DB4DC0
MSFDDLSSSFAELSFSVPSFSTAEPGDGQRWTTWPATTPTERGPRPHPDWLITSAGAIDTELGVVKTGKEADVHLIERAVPDEPAQRVLLAAKRYRDAANSDFHRSARYQEGRRMRNTRDSRAVARSTAYGRQVSAGRWAYAEFETLSRLFTLGLPVPYPVQVHGTELLMELIGDGVEAAPRLAQARLTVAELASCFDQVADAMRALARAGLAHGDLSAYNLLVHHGRVVVIDLPQVVEVVSNPGGLDFLQRDCTNVCDWFTRRGLERDAGELFGELVAELY